MNITQYKRPASKLVLYNQQNTKFNLLMAFYSYSISTSFESKICRCSSSALFPTGSSEDLITRGRGGFVFCILAAALTGNTYLLCTDTWSCRHHPRIPWGAILTFNITVLYQWLSQRSWLIFPEHKISNLTDKYHFDLCDGKDMDNLALSLSYKKISHHSLHI